MANYRLSGYTTEAPLFLGSTAMCGRTISNSTAGGTSAEWTKVRLGTATSLSKQANALLTFVGRDDSSPYLALNRSFLQFALPNNLSRLDNLPQLSLYASTATGNKTVVPTGVDYTNFESTWSDMSAINAQTSPLISAGAAYVGGSHLPSTIAAGENTITLNELARYQILLGATAVASGVKYFTIAILDYQYDWGNTLPADGVTNNLVFHDVSDANPPSLILRNPWFINDKGDDFPVAGDYVIRANEVGVSQFDRSVPQLPFSQNIKGPRSLRGKNIPYKVTT